ncbi:hypothetical protein GCM10009682_40920 [Luedemannella flava]|uniref:Histidine kinase/HSP90-like ATPase domain-containing protein n=1 Tax=Luedemannella flava TaxID=349316 RepID=A0ABN2M9E4_9ACTN
MVASRLICRGIVNGERVTETFAPVAESVPRARTAATAVCGRWEIPPDVTQRVQVIVTELAGNAVRHARTPYELVLRRSGATLYLAVRDGDDRPARLLGPLTPTSAGGRGLILVDAYASAWGCFPTIDGKTTWALLRQPAEPPVSPAP